MPRRNLFIILLMALVSLSCYQRATRNPFAATMAEAMNVIQRDYVDDVEPRLLFEGAMGGMVDKLDPNSKYTSPEEFKQFKDSLGQEFGGIGIVVEFDEASQRLAVAGLLPNTPAFHAGIRAGDLIMALEGEDTAGLKLINSTDKIRGAPGTSLKMKVLHPGEKEPVDIVVTRAKIAVDSVLGDARDASGKWVYRLSERPEVGYIRVQSFGERTTDELKAALQATKQYDPPVQGLILDLRGNAGGLLTSAVATCDAFLDKGVIVSTKGRNASMLQQFSASPGDELVDAKLPVVVLIDKKSASASEIVSACLQDHGRAKIVGQRSYGKGTVQNVITLEGGRSALRLTIARYTRPSGKNIHKLQNALEEDAWGVSPDPGEEISLTNRETLRYQMVRNRRDNQDHQGKIPEKATLPATSSEGKAAPAEAAQNPAPEKVPTGEGADNPTAEEEALSREELTPEDKLAAEKGILFADPQLQKAVDCLLKDKKS